MTGKDTETATIRIKGMTCNHCVMSVKKALASSPGVEAAEVDLGSGKAMISGRDFDISSLLKAVEELGYEAGVGE